MYTLSMGTLEILTIVNKVECKIVARLSMVSLGQFSLNINMIKI